MKCNLCFSLDFRLKTLYAKKKTGECKETERMEDKKEEKEREICLINVSCAAILFSSLLILENNFFLKSTIWLLISWKTEGINKQLIDSEKFTILPVTFFLRIVFTYLWTDNPLAAIPILQGCQNNIPWNGRSRQRIHQAAGIFSAPTPTLFIDKLSWPLRSPPSLASSWCSMAKSIPVSVSSPDLQAAGVSNGAARLHGRFRADSAPSPEPTRTVGSTRVGELTASWSVAIVRLLRPYPVWRQREPTVYLWRNPTGNIQSPAAVPFFLKMTPAIYETLPLGTAARFRLT